MNPAQPVRLAVVLSHPTQYYSPWFRWLREHERIEFRVFYLWDFGVKPRVDAEFGVMVRWDVDLLGGYDSEFVPNLARDPGTHHFTGLRNPSLAARLSAWDPTALLVFGYSWLGNLQAIFWAMRHRRPVIFRGDSHFIGRRPGWLRKIHPGWLYRRLAAFAFVGKANRSYYLALGVPARRLFFAPHAVDQALYSPSDRTRRQAAEIRAGLGIPAAALVVLFAGKLVAGKNPRRLLQAFLELSRPGAVLIFVGDGGEKSALEETARAAPAGSVHFLPFANQSEMPARYQLADLFVLPSSAETWGLAVNEAMHMGVPCLVSDRVGCQADLVDDGITGWVCRQADPGALRAKLGEALAVLAEPAAAAAVRRNAGERISGYTYRRAGEGLLAALASVAPR